MIEPEPLGGPSLLRGIYRDLLDPDMLAGIPCLQSF
jgi:hypothetical protein